MLSRQMEIQICCLSELRQERVGRWQLKIWYWWGGQGHGMGMQREVRIHSIGRTSGRVDAREVDGKEKQESDRIVELFWQWWCHLDMGGWSEDMCGVKVIGTYLVNTELRRDSVFKSHKLMLSKSLELVRSQKDLICTVTLKLQCYQQVTCELPKAHMWGNLATLPCSREPWKCSWCQPLLLSVRFRLRVAKQSVPKCYRARQKEACSPASSSGISRLSALILVPGAKW